MIKRHFFYLIWIVVGCTALLLSSCAKKEGSLDDFYDSVISESNTIRDYLQAKSLDSGVHYHPSGIAYKILLPGNGRDTIKINNIPTLVYTTKLFGDDRIVESSLNLPTSFDNRLLKDHIAGWQIGLTLISKGGRIILYIPSRLAFGQIGIPPRIPPNSILVCDITLVDFK